MARPTKSGGDWFKHDINLRNDRRVKTIRAKHGTVGYGVFVMLIEVLVASNHFSVYADEVELLCLSSDFGVEIEELTGVIHTAISVNLLSYNEEGALYSPLVTTMMQVLLVKRSRDKARLNRYRDDNNENNGYRGDNGRKYAAPCDNSDLEAIFATPTHDTPRQPTE